MADRVLIFGKDTWPHTTSAREAYEGKNLPVEYKDVTRDKGALEEMLTHTKGRRDVPVIVEGSEVTIGFGGTWAV